MITHPLRLLFFLFLVGVTAPAFAESVRGQAIGPRSMRPRTHRATVLRPEDAPPALPTSMPGVETRRGSTVRLMTFEDLPRQVSEALPRSLTPAPSKAKQPATPAPQQRASASQAEPPLTEPLPLDLPAFESPATPPLTSKAAVVARKKGKDNPVDNDFLKFDSPSEPFTIPEATASPRSITPSDPQPARHTPSTTVPTPVTLTAPVAQEDTNRDTTGKTKDTIRTLGAPSPSSSLSEAVAPGEPTSFVDLSWLPEGSATLSTTGSAVALAVGLLLLMLVVLRKAMPRSARPLPEDVISLLGRVTLSNKQSAQLMKVGSKLVLVAMTPDGAKPITEIDDPEEVARLLGLIEQANPAGASAAFREVFDQVARESAPSGFLGEDLPPFGPAPTIDRGQIAAAYSQTPGGRRYAA